MTLLHYFGTRLNKDFNVPQDGKAASPRDLTPPAGGRVLVLANGAYGRRMARICEVRLIGSLSPPSSLNIDLHL